MLVAVVPAACSCNSLQKSCFEGSIVHGAASRVKVLQHEGGDAAAVDAVADIESSYKLAHCHVSAVLGVIPRSDICDGVVPHCRGYTMKRCGYPSRRRTVMDCGMRMAYDLLLPCVLLLSSGPAVLDVGRQYSVSAAVRYVKHAVITSSTTGTASTTESALV